MGKYFDLMSSAMGVGAEKQKSSREDRKNPVVSTPIPSPIAVSHQTYEPFGEDSEMESYEDSGAEDGSGNDTNMELGATTGNNDEEDLDELIKLKLEALGRIK